MIVLILMYLSCCREFENYRIILDKAITDPPQLPHVPAPAPAPVANERVNVLMKMYYLSMSS